MQKVLFLDRDGTLALEPPDYQLDSLAKLEFYPSVFRWLGRLVREMDFRLVMVTNQDGLGTDSFPEADFWPCQNFILQALENEGIVFDEIIIDRTFAKDNLPTRKPGTALLTNYLTGEYDMPNSYVIGDRLTDMKLAENLGCKGIWINTEPKLGAEELEENTNLAEIIALTTTEWQEIYHHIRLQERTSQLVRETKETRVSLKLDLDGTGATDINTGLQFFDHMLDQLGKHSGCDLILNVNGDLEVDEHHTIEDTALALGEAFRSALGDKLGIERYGFHLAMDDALAQVALDFGGRPWLVWDADYKREYVGDMPTEMFHHFFKSFADAARCNLNIKVTGNNEHHKIEATFKGLAKAIKMAKKRDIDRMVLPSTKGTL
ncbi:MAG: bifunctional histidinol-phosphatase/imidazoleglycerol-phosphate dehydratase HisB [Bacteroidota bacterium]